MLPQPVNRNELIEYLRNPSSLTSDNLEELESIIVEAPYFQSVRMLLAKGSQMMKDPSTKNRIASAAIYATDRPLLKKYISRSTPPFLVKPPAEQSQPQESEPLIRPSVPSGILDTILEELEQDMEDLKSSRAKFADVQQQIEEEDAVSEALEKMNPSAKKKMLTKMNLRK